MAKNRRYLWYLLRHKFWVFVYGIRLGIPLLALMHDQSKFDPEEWGPYADWFYGYEGGPYAPHQSVHDYTQRKLDFIEAFQHHWMRNKHHWQYWCATIHWDTDGHGYSMLHDEANPRPMPDRYRREMVADWMGAGRAISGRNDVLAWYIKNQGGIMLHAETRAWVERAIGFAHNELEG